jgi:hypothetical protein
MVPSEQELWYRAGRKAVRRQLWLWRSAVAALLLVSVGLLMWRSKQATLTVDRFIYVRQPAAIVASSDLRSGKQISAQFFQLRDALEEKGLEALPLIGGVGASDQPVIRAWSPTLSVETQSHRG